MTSEPVEAEVSAVSAAQSASGAGEAGTLVEVTFQKNPSQKYKYLEAEPKILGVTEIALTVFFVVCRLTIYGGSSEWILNNLMLVFSCVQGSPNLFLEGRCPAEFISNLPQHTWKFQVYLVCLLRVGAKLCRDTSVSFVPQHTNLGIISGSVAIAAQKLHLPTLKACLGMQMVTCMAYSFCFLGTIVLPYSDITGCWRLYNESEMAYENDACAPLEKGLSQLRSLDQLMEATQIVLSVTLAAYCCKVIPCCSPRSHVPVIMMPPTTPQ